jgi:uncharacterized membrane protein
MNAFFARNWFFIVATVAIAIGVHAVTLALLPNFVMAQLLDRLAREGGYNTMHHASRADDNSRIIVRPSPDLLYSICPFDLNSAHGAVHVQADVPDGTYWSVSLFSDNTNNFFVENDRQAKRGRVDFVIVGPRTGTVDDTDRWTPPQIYSPSIKGLVLVRTLINDESRFAEIDQARRRVTCTPYR